MGGKGGTPKEKECERTASDSRGKINTKSNWRRGMKNWPTGRRGVSQRGRKKKKRGTEARKGAWTKNKRILGGRKESGSNGRVKNIVIVELTGKHRQDPMGGGEVGRGKNERLPWDHPSEVSEL